MSDNDDFVSFPLSKIQVEQSLPADIYFYIAGKFLKYLNKDDELSSEKYDYLILKKCQFIFIKHDELTIFKEWVSGTSEEVKDELVDKLGEKFTDIVEAQSEVREVLAGFFTKEVTKQSVKEVMDSTKSFIESMNSADVGEKFLMQLSRLGDDIVDHSMSVANISTYLAKATGFNSPEALESIYLGGLLHDYGKTRVNKKHLDKPDTAEAKKALNNHPALGKTALLLEDGFSDDTLRIIGEHHENHDGSGHPKGLKAKRIFDLAKVVAIANTYDNLVRSQNGELQAKQLQAINKLKEDKGKQFDPLILQKCIEAFEAVI